MDLLLITLILTCLALLGLIYYGVKRREELATNYLLVLEQKDEHIVNLEAIVTNKDEAINELQLQITQKEIVASQVKDMISRLPISKTLQLEIMRRL